MPGPSGSHQVVDDKALSWNDMGLIDAHIRYVLRRFSRRYRQLQGADHDDIRQEVYLRLIMMGWPHGFRFDDTDMAFQSRFHAILTSIIHRSIDMIRGRHRVVNKSCIGSALDKRPRKRKWLLANVSLSETLADRIPARESGGSQAFVDSLLDLKTAMSRLTPEGRAILILRDSGHTLQEIAERTGLPLSSVHRLITQALKDLAIFLQT